MTVAVINVSAHAYAVLIAAHVCVAAARALCLARTLPRATIPTTLPLFFSHLTLVAAPWHVPLHHVRPTRIPLRHLRLYCQGRLLPQCKESIASVLIFCPVIHPNNLVMSRVQLGCSALIFLITGLLWQRSCVSSLTTSPIINTHFKGVCSLCSTLYIL